MKVRHIAMSLCCFAMLSTTAAHAAAEEKGEPVKTSAHAKVAKEKHIEVVFALDSTSSMSGMIAGAKERIWSIVNMMSQSAERPQIKIGLVSYRDRGDAYVTKMLDLTDDLDKMYAYLMDIKAQGGGDTPESVNQGLNEAIEKITWSQNKDAYRVVFLVGDCPPHLDYKDDISYQDSCAIAIKKGIFVNTILCGNDSQAKTIWLEIAALGKGEFSQIHQSGGVTAVVTPQDKKMVELSKKMDQTRVYLKKDLAVQQNRAKTADKQYEYSSIGSNASRAAFNCTVAGNGNFLGQNELVESIQSGKLKIKDIKKEELPDDLAGKTETEISNYIKQKHTERHNIQKEILSLQKKRSTWITENTTSKEDSFDVQVQACIKKQISTP